MGWPAGKTVNCSRVNGQSTLEGSNNADSPDSNGSHKYLNCRTAVLAAEALSAVAGYVAFGFMAAQQENDHNCLVTDAACPSGLVASLILGSVGLLSLCLTAAVYPSLQETEQEPLLPLQEI